jgi:DNA processing protein
MSSKEDWLKLYFTPGLGSGGIRNLINHFGTPAEIFAASSKELQRGSSRLSRKTLATIGGDELRKAAEKELERTTRAGVTILCWDDDNFPGWLKNIPDPPILLFVKGKTEVLSEPGISIVGSRAASVYGLKMAGELSRQLATHGFTVISGLALGIDAAAHRGALAAHGKTIAVLGCGLDITYPEQNRDLFESIPDNGAIISEYTLGTSPDSFRFPARNRLISGLGSGVVVVEAAGRSGSLITAELALDQGREVFAVPGRADSIKSTGAHRLLQAGAKLVLSVNDIICEIPPISNSPGEREKQLSAKSMASFHETVHKANNEEKKVLDQLEVYPKTVDDVIVGSELAVEKVNELLLTLELKGLCEALPGGQYQLKQ